MRVTHLQEFHLSFEESISEVLMRSVAASSSSASELN
jgi:hypothetical protein